MDFAKEKLKRLQQRLLKLSTGNQLLNTNFRARGLDRFRIIDELPDNIYKMLSNEKLLRFDPLPPFDDIPKDERSRKFIKALEDARLSDEQYLRKMAEIESEEAEDMNQAAEDAELALRILVRKNLGLPNLENLKVNDLKRHAESKDIRADYSLPKPDAFPVPSNHKYTDSRIQTLLLPDRLKRYERSIARKTSSILKETGINALYFAFGFLEWKASDNAERRLVSPLLLLPVELVEERKGAPRKVKGTGDSLTVNETLHEKLRQDFRIELPTLPELDDDSDDYSIEAYWSQVEDAISEIDSWSLKRWVSFGTYTDQNMPIFRDLGQLIDRELSDLLQRILSGVSTGDPNQSQEDYDVDTIETEKKLPALIEPADASQFSAVIDVLDQKNLVIKGPPGTGKSQTITNIITTLLGQGKRVLFVAQKQAALDVVRNNLKKNGYEDYMLEAFSSKANKTQIFESIAKRVEKPRPQRSDLYSGRLKEYRRVKSALNDYSSVMAEKFGRSGKTVQEIFWDLPAITDVSFEELESFHLPAPEEISHSDLLSNMEEIQYYARSVEFSVTEFSNSFELFRAVKARIDDPFKLEDLVRNITRVAVSIEKLKLDIKTLASEYPSIGGSPELDFSQISALNEINSAFGHDLPALRLIFNKGSLDVLKRLSDFLDDSADHNLAVASIQHIDLDDDENNLTLEFGHKAPEKHNDWLASLHKLAGERLEAKRQGEELASKFDVKNSIYSLEDYRSAAKTLRLTGVFSLLSSEWRKARALFEDIWISDDKLDHNAKGKALTDLYESRIGMQEKDERLSELADSVSRVFEELKYEMEEKNERLQKFEGEIQRDLHGIGSNIHNAEAFIARRSWGDVEKLFSSIEFLTDDVSQGLTSDASALSHYLLLQESTYSIDQEVSKLIKELVVDASQVVEKSDARAFIKQLSDNSVDFQKFMKQLLLEERKEDTFAGKFFAFAKKCGVQISEMHLAYKFIVRKAQQRIIYDRHKEVLNLSTGEDLKKLQADLKRLDRDLSEIAREELNADIWEASSLAKVPAGVAYGRVAEKTEKGLIEHITNKPRSRVALRQLFRNAGGSVSQLKPCFLMSPLTVSQMLPMAELFDVLIIDEASQLKPEFAIPAIARAKQAVIVGDQHQLPPDNRFTGVSDEEEEDFTDESILDMAITTLSPARSLLWHYRSRHEDLIKFSNQEFYNNLMIPITADPDQKNRGITRHFVENAVYRARTDGQSGGINEKERDAIVDDIVEFMQTRRDESLGVVAMNKQQTEIIEYAFQQVVEKDPSIQDYVDHWKAKNEGVQEFFIKSLENVQGDERDVMIIGTTYGPNSEGRVHQRFTISGSYGRRRLNVLITRAKHEVRLFTSLPLDQLSDTDDPARSTFKKYLEFARSGMLPEGRISGHLVDNPFQQWAIDQVNAIPGFSADYEVGVRGYRIDIAVKHKDFGGWVMAVETDGATYHSSRAARDRDLLRQEILEGYGWVFHRIWSTDWLNDPVGVKERLRSALLHRVEMLRNDLEQAGSDSLAVSDQRAKRHESEMGKSDVQADKPVVESKAYPIADICDVINPDPDAFYWDTYRIRLATAIEHVINIEGPIERKLLITRIREGHGFRKAGDPIRQAIMKAVPKSVKRSEFNDLEFFWPAGSNPENWSRGRFPLASGEEADKRKFDEVSPEELAAISVIAGRNKPALSPTQMAREISRYLGWQKCSNKAAEHIVEALELAKNQVIIED